MILSTKLRTDKNQLNRNVKRNVEQEYQKYKELENNEKYGTTHVLFVSTYTAKQLRIMYYSHSYITASKVWYFR